MSRESLHFDATPDAGRESVALGSVLVVDDEEFGRDMVQRRLRRAGYDVAVAASGLEALKILRKQAYDLVLLDVMMPGVDGRDVWRVLREVRATSNMAVIGVPAEAEPAVRTTASATATNINNNFVFIIHLLKKS